MYCLLEIARLQASDRIVVNGKSVNKEVKYKVYLQKYEEHKFLGKTF